MSEFPIFDSSTLKTKPLAERQNRVSVDNFIRLPQVQPRETAENRLPDILGGRALKDFSRRIYIGSGVYAEVALYFKAESFRPFFYIYRDYRDQKSINLFNKMRKIISQG